MQTILRKYKIQGRFHVLFKTLQYITNEILQVYNPNKRISRKPPPITPRIPKLHLQFRDPGTIWQESLKQLSIAAINKSYPEPEWLQVYIDGCKIRIHCNARAQVYRQEFAHYLRARWKVLNLAYVKLGTSGCWVGTQTGAGDTAILVSSFSAAADVHGGMDYNHKSFTLVLQWHQLLSGSLPNGHLSRVSCRL